MHNAHGDDPEFGHRLLADEARQAGESMPDRTPWKIATVQGKPYLCTIKDAFSNKIVGYSID